MAKTFVTVMNSSLQDAVSNSFIPVNVAKGEKLPEDEEKAKEKSRNKRTIEKTDEDKYSNYHTIIIDERKTFKLEEIVSFIKESRGTPIYMYILFASLMGLRKSEISGLKYSDIDYIHRKLYLDRQLGKKRGVKKEDVPAKTFTKQEIPLKSKSSYRKLDIPDLVFDAILEERKLYEQRKNRRKNDKNNPFQDLDYICCSTHGRPRSRGFLFKYFKELKEKLNMPDLPFHKLRTTYTTILAKNNFSMKAISQMLGHSSEMITFENYTDKNEIIQDCLTELEPYIIKLLEDDKEKIIDCTNIKIDMMMDEYYQKLCA